MSIEIERKIDEYMISHRHPKINCVLLYKDGKILANRYYNGFHEGSKNVILSVAKSIMSISTGIALEKGLLKDLNEPIYKYIPEFAKGDDPLHRMITVKHLLTMTSGIYWNGGIHYHCPMKKQMVNSGDWIRYIAECPVTDIPGTKYNYKEWDVILLAKFLDGICKDMFDFINENLFLPLGIESERWYRSPCGIYYSVGDNEDGDNETEFKMTASDMLKIGKLCLNLGVFEGKRIISKHYIKQAITPLKCNPNYGYLFWIWEDCYGCRGYGGQNIIIIPKEKVIIVIQATPSDRGMVYQDVIQYCRELAI